jgi:hypothetical protein
MAQTFKGFVGRINEKSGTGRKGRWTLYSTKLQDANGEDSTDWLSFGFEKPNVKAGDYVKVTVEEVDGRERVTEVKKLKNPPARAATSGGSGSASSDSGMSKQSSIHYQNSRTAAIETVKLLIEADALALPKAATKPGEAKRFAIIEAAIDKFTVRYYNDLETMRLLETVADSGVTNSAPDSPLPPDADGDDDEDEDEAEEEEEEEEEEDEDD